jgi:PKHD-type hydroxylase
VYILNLLQREHLERLNAQLTPLEWNDGAETAKGSAKRKKNNLQITGRDIASRSLLSELVKAIQTNPTVSAIALPRKILSPRFAKYTNGGAYGWHVDLSHMEGYRTDLSFTLFLNEPEEYEGGELHLDYRHLGRQKIKCKAGQMVLYPTGVLHEVTPVTRGERVVMVGWINSLVSHQSDRDSLLSLFGSVEKLRKLKDQNELSQSSVSPIIDRLNESYFNLLRSMID